MALHTTILQKITINSPCVAHGIRKLNGPNRGPRPNGTDDFFFLKETLMNFELVALNISSTEVTYRRFSWSRLINVLEAWRGFAAPSVWPSQCYAVVKY